MGKRIAILGASGAVGQEMMKILAERDLPLDELRLLSGPNSAGKAVEFRGEQLLYRQAAEGSFEGLDIVLGAAENDVAREMWPHIKASGALFIDNSSEFRLDPDVPLVVPEVNGDDAFGHHGLISNPNCVTIIALMALKPISDISPIKTLVASSYQAVSGAGAGGIRELDEQIRAYAAGKEQPFAHGVFAQQIAFNLIPKIGSVGSDGYSSEEMKLQNEGRKIMHLPEMKVCCTCVRVPVFRSHAISMQLTTEEPVSVEAVKAAILKADGVSLADIPNAELYPMPIDCSDQDLVYVGRIRRDNINENGLALWCCGDQIRKGAAGNAVQIAEMFL